MAVEGLDAGEEFAVVANRDEDLGVRAHGGLEEAERAGGELVLFQLGKLVLTVGRRLAWQWAGRRGR